jgi:hypothetical protein
VNEITKVRLEEIDTEMIVATKQLWFETAH